MQINNVTWKQVASTRAKREMESQAVSPEGKGRLREAANATKRKPAGMRRKAETKNGPHFGITSFMATIAVPQKKKGETNTAHSHTSLTSAAESSSSDRATLSSELDEETTDSTSCPVPTQSKSTAPSSSSSPNSVFVPLVHLARFLAPASNPVNFFLFLTLLLSLKCLNSSLVEILQEDDEIEGVEDEKLLRERGTRKRHE